MFDKFQYVEFRSELPKAFDKDKPYNLAIPITRNWEKAKEKLLVVVGRPNFRDVKDGSLFTPDGEPATVFTNVFNYALSEALKIDPKVKTHGLAAINYETFKTYDYLDNDQALQLARKHFQKRLCSFIHKMRPTKILIIGDDTATDIQGDQLDFLMRDARTNKFNIKYEYKDKKLKIPTFSTISYDASFSSKGDDTDDLDDSAVMEANLLGYVSRSFTNCLLGYNPFTFSDARIEGKNPNISYSYVDTIKKFDAMMKDIRESKSDGIGYDLETTGLETHTIKLLSMQWAVSKNHGYWVTLYHKDTPFTSKELEYIRLEVRKFFDEGKYFTPKRERNRYLLGANIGYDIRATLAWTKLPYTEWSVWDIQAGEHALDENIKGLGSKGSRPFALDTVCAYYGNYHYYTSEFGKADRTTIKDIDIDKKAPVVKYGVMDAVTCLHIQELQAKRSTFMTIGKKAEFNYAPFFHKLVLAQYSNNIKRLHGMTMKGILVDIDYILDQMGPNSAILKMVDEESAELLESPYVKSLEKKLRSQRGISNKAGLFSKVKGASDTSTFFNRKKENHIDQLFFDEMGLESVSETKGGKQSTAKVFKEAYRKEFREVEIYAHVEELEKLKGTFIDKIFEHIQRNPDSLLDHRLRAQFGFHIVTGRSNSSKPSMQQIPNHSKEAKHVKRQFISQKGSLLFDADYSSWEVFQAGQIAGDKAMLSGFQAIHNIRVKFKMYPNGDNKIQLMIAGDSHKMNYSRFTGMPINEWIDLDLTPEGQGKAKALRQIAKGIVFGALYGLSVNSLARDLGLEVEEAQAILDSFYNEFSELKDWLAWTRSHSRKHLYTFAQTGRRRNLFGYLTGNKQQCAAMERRAQNSPGQGQASDFMFTAAELVARKQYDLLRKLSKKDSRWDRDIHEMFKYGTGPSVMIHDSAKSEAPFNMLLLSMHMKEWCMTSGVVDYMDEIFNVTVPRTFGIDHDVGARWDCMGGWDGDPIALPSILETALVNHNETHHVDNMNVNKTMRRMMDDYHRQRDILKLDKIMPLNFNTYT